MCLKEKFPREGVSYFTQIAEIRVISYLENNKISDERLWYDLFAPLQVMVQAQEAPLFTGESSHPTYLRKPSHTPPIVECARPVPSAIPELMLDSPGLF